MPPGVLMLVHWKSTFASPATPVLVAVAVLMSQIVVPAPAKILSTPVRPFHVMSERTALVMPVEDRE